MSAPGETRDFWSRRRAGVEAEQQAERDARRAELLAEEEARLAEKSDADFLAELDLPEPEAMDSTEQVQTLLKSAVPQRLKTRALRRLWRLNPVLANVDGLVDYGQDFTDAAMVVENMQTAYQVGKGMLKAIEWESPKPYDAEAAAAAEAAEDAAAEQAKAEQAAADAEQSDSEGGTAPAEDHASPAEPLAAGHPAEAAAAPQAYAAAPEDIADMQPAPPRRMRFRFDTAT